MTLPKRSNKMAKKVVATLKTGDSKQYTKVINMVKNKKVLTLLKSVL